MGKDLATVLQHKKAAIANAWFNLAVQAYPPEAAEFFKGQTDSFANPVGSITSKGIRSLLDQLLQGMDRNTLTVQLDAIIRVRAVQNFTPSQATAFIPALKTILRAQLEKELRDNRMAGELIEFESKIDLLCLMAFDIYMQCREKIYQIRANETRNRTFKAFERAGLITETPDSGSDI
jgi:hypothetical protein